MGNKLILLLIGILIPCILYCQEKKLVESQVFYDKTNQLPIFRISKEGKKIEVDYYTALDTINSISINIGFIGGVERLHKYCDSLYYANFNEENYNEVNVRVPYSILLDNELRVQEVHILQGLSYKYDEKYDYDSLIKKILFSTNGQWFKKDKKNSWYIYVGLFHLK
jgi:hypothetical protein